jgi:hypothetical protein
VALVWQREGAGHLALVEGHCSKALFTPALNKCALASGIVVAPLCRRVMISLDGSVIFCGELRQAPGSIPGKPSAAWHCSWRRPPRMPSTGDS